MFLICTNVQMILEQPIYKRGSLATFQVAVIATNWQWSLWGSRQQLGQKVGVVLC